MICVSQCACRSTAVGCPDLELPASSAAYVIRSDDIATVICNDSSPSATSRGVHKDPLEASEHRHHHRRRQQLVPAPQQRQSWDLECHGTQWTGHYGNCTRHRAGAGDDKEQQQQQQHVFSTEHVIQRDGNQSYNSTLYCTAIRTDKKLTTLDHRPGTYIR